MRCRVFDFRFANQRRQFLSSRRIRCHGGRLCPHLRATPNIRPAPPPELQQFTASGNAYSSAGMPHEATFKLSSSPEAKDTSGVVHPEVRVRDPHTGITPLNPPIHESDSFPKWPRFVERQSGMGTARDGVDACATNPVPLVNILAPGEEAK
jgi:hypothetical protein